MGHLHGQRGLGNAKLGKPLRDAFVAQNGVGLCGGCEGEVNGRNKKRGLFQGPWKLVSLKGCGGSQTGSSQ